MVSSLTPLTNVYYQSNANEMQETQGVYGMESFAYHRLFMKSVTLMQDCNPERSKTWFFFFTLILEIFYLLKRKYIFNEEKPELFVDSS